jgi:uncharacterized membrane protein
MIAFFYKLILEFFMKRIIVFFFASILVFSPHCFAYEYEIFDLDPDLSDNAYFHAYDINDFGQIVGLGFGVSGSFIEDSHTNNPYTLYPPSYSDYWNRSGIVHLWDGNMNTTDIGYAHNRNAIIYKHRSNLRINNSGQILGGFGVWENGEIITEQTGRAINDSGDIIYSKRIAEYPEVEGYILKNGEEISLGKGLGVRDINNKGQIAVLNGTIHGGTPAIWDNGQVTNIVEGRLSFFNSSMIINDAGQVLVPGWNIYDAQGNEKRTPLLWDNGDVVEGVLPEGENNAWGLDLNDKGQVVGTIRGTEAFVWDAGEIKNLNELVDAPEILEEARAINNDGWILANSSRSAYLLKPIVVPEPLSCVLMLLGGCATMLKSRKKKV